ncbi:hypothetical protein NX059_004331 [Plenodomus lindquistii]|nr:hypothetical protein NX059_004331 [Plenodomus lindquistii]
MSADTERVDVLGRSFQKISLDDDIYLAPVAIDDREEDRLTSQHDILLRLLGDNLFSGRIALTNPRKVLDCGYGGGDWCVQFAEEYEDCEITGVDIFPLRVADQPVNLTLCSYNLNDRLRDPEVFQARAYDLVHSRFLFPGIKSNRWPSYMVEYYPLIQSDSGRLTEQAAVRRWWLSYESSMRRLNRDPRIGRKLQQLMIEKGYKDVRVDIERLPIGAWHPDPSKSSIGAEAVTMIADLVESLGIWPFTTILGWSAAQYEYLMTEVRSELQNADLKLYIDIYFARGRRSTRG